MEADILAETPRISNESLVWKALLWKKKNDVVKIKAQWGTYEYKIVKIWE
jgi:transcription elongation GreA/GreB family factor